MAPTTLLGQQTTTSPYGRDAFNEGYPLKVCELLAALEAPVYLERVALGDTKQVLGAARAIKKALANQARGLGFSLVEILSPCPTIWKLSPTDAQRRVREEMVKAFPLGVYRDRAAQATARPAPPPPPALEDLPRLLDLGAHGFAPEGPRPGDVDLRIKVAGFGGQGVLMLGEVLAEAGLLMDLEVSWLPSYGPEMRSGTSHCHVRISSRTIASPLVAKPGILLALNEPSLRKFIPHIEPGGWVLYNHHTLPEGVDAPAGVNVLCIPFTELADTLGEPRVGNIVMLGALLEAAGLLPAGAVDHALEVRVKSARWLELDRRALALGREAARKELAHACV